MVDHTTHLDDHRGLKARAAAELRRMRAGVEPDQADQCDRRCALESLLAASPSVNWHEAVERARYLLDLFAETPAAADPRRQRLLDELLADFERLLKDEPELSR